MRIIFMGTPAFALPSLASLLLAGHEIPAVVTQPDRPAGRGRLPVPPAVKGAALERGLTVLQPERLRDAEAVAELRRLGPEAIVVAAFGQILPRSVLAIPPHGCVNVHASLLPKYRGAAPINAAIREGDELTGVTIMLMDPGLDTGPILAQRSEQILADDTAESLGRRLAELGGSLIAEVLPGWIAGTVTPRAQNESEASYAPMLKREDGHIDWGKSAVAIERLCRAYYPWPGCYSYLDQRLLKFLKVKPLPFARRDALPGELMLGLEGAALAVATGDGALSVEQLQMEGKRPMSAGELVRGHRDVAGHILH